MNKFERLAAPLVKLAEKNRPDQFMQGGLIDMALFSEAGIAEYIAAGTDGRLLWCEPNGWLVYEEKSGAYTTSYAESVVYELIKYYRDKVLSLIGQTDTQNQNIAFNFYKSLLNASTTRAVVGLLKHEPSIAALPVDFDNNMDVVNCAGTVVLTDGNTRPATPEDRFTQSAICKPEPGIPENFMSFINWSSSGDRELVEWKLTAYGIALFGHPTDRIINLYGTGRNGKGTELRTLFKIMGGYATVLPRALAIKEPHSSSRFDREGLVGKRMAALFDLKPEMGKLNLDDLKTLCGNGDPQSVEPKGKPRYNAVISCKVFLSSNDKIPVDSYGPSEKRRFYLVPFSNQIEEVNEALEERFGPEYGKILNLLIEYAAKYFNNGRKMPPCTAIDRATADYFDSQDLVGQFINDNCDTGEALFVGKTELYNAFATWCESEQGIKRPMKPKTFSANLEKRGIYETVKLVSGKAKRVFKGIITILQKNPKNDLLSHEEQNFNTNSFFENSCNSVISEPKAAEKPAPEPCFGTEKKPVHPEISPEDKAPYDYAYTESLNRGYSPEEAGREARGFVAHLLAGGGS